MIAADAKLRYHKPLIMEEPTVLDYVKSKIFFWRSEKIEIPPVDAQEGFFTGDSADELELQPVASVESTPKITPVPEEPFDFWPLLHLILPLMLALVAQRFLEPPDRSVATGVILYALAAAWVVWASWRGEWKLPTRQVEYHLGWQDNAFRPISLVIAILLSAAQFIIGNVLEPAIMGRTLNLSPFVVMVSLAFWGMIWGLVGAFLSVPLTAAIAIACSKVESWRWFAVLLSEDGRIDEWRD